MMRHIPRVLTVITAVVLVSPLVGGAANAVEAASNRHHSDGGDRASLADPTHSPSIREKRQVPDPDRTFNKKFKRSDVREMPRFNRCVKIKVRGRIKGRREQSGHGNIDTTWKNVRVLHPAVKVKVGKLYPPRYPYDCSFKVRRSLKKFTIRQQWKTKGCKVEVQSVNVGYPWNIGASFGCEDGVAKRRSSTDGKGSAATQLNKDTKIRYERETTHCKCPFRAAVRVQVRVHKKTKHGHVNQLLQEKFRVKLRKWNGNYRQG